MKRPRECESCSKKSCIQYTFVQQELVESFESCEECPILLKKLSKAETVDQSFDPDLFCPLCHTKFEDISMGRPVGCPECFSLFEEKISQELKRLGLLPTYTTMCEDPNATFSLGKAPNYGELESIKIHLPELRKALNNALKLENYEEAAILRDKIKQMNHST